MLSWSTLQGDQESVAFSFEMISLEKCELDS